VRLIVGASCAVVLATVTHLRAVDGGLACANVAKLALAHGNGGTLSSQATCILGLPETI